MTASRRSIFGHFPHLSHLKNTVNHFTLSQGQCQGMGPVSPPPTKSYFKILGYQSTYIIKNLGYQGSQSSKAGSFSNLLAKRFVSWHFPPKFGEHITIELESEDSRWTFCYSQGLQIRLYLTRCFRILVYFTSFYTFC